MKKSGYMMRQAFEHALASVVVVGCAVGASIICYLGLLSWAVITGAPIGGPLALPLMMLLALLGSLASICLVLMPITALGHWLCTSARPRPVIVQIPMTTGLLIIELLIIALVSGLIGDYGMSTSLGLGFGAALILLVPLGAYWWTLQITDWLISMISTCWIRFRAPTPIAE
jgi:hypothetical protein